MFWRKLLMFGLATASRLFVDLVGAAHRVCVIGGEVKHADLIQRGESERFALNHRGGPSDTVPPGELDVLPAKVQAGEGVAAHDVGLDQEGRSLLELCGRAAGNVVAGVE